MRRQARRFPAVSIAKSAANSYNPINVGPRLKNIGLTEAVHATLLHKLEREQGKPSLVELGVQFCR